MKKSTTTGAVLLLAAASAVASAQTGSSQRIPIRKDVPPATMTSAGDVTRPTVDTVMMTETLVQEW